ncbi:hypothetical protein FQA39_LY05118 [Lamprigera yunnana]|nr:hypothetical protein FQA39_LY05118 [Lamprigera yunnana]
MSLNTNSNGSRCGICGREHDYSNCDFLQIIKKVPDKALPSKARLTLPEVVSIETMADGTFAIVANTFIKKGTQFGPLEARKLLTLDPNIIFPLKLFNNDVEDFSEYYLNTFDEHNCNWIMFITPAQNFEEQNLICFQEELNIFYVCLKDVKAGEYLKVWYSPYYAKKMHKEVLMDQKQNDVVSSEDTAKSESIDLNKLLKKQEKIKNRDIWTCKFCGKLEKEVTMFAKHIIEHYCKKLTKHCNICDESFSTLKDLRKHVKLKHKKHKSKVNTINKLSCQNFKAKDALVGGPLLNDLLNDSLDNTNLVLLNNELNMNALESDTLNLAVDNLLTENVKELDHFNFEIGESQEQHVCDICLRVFTKLHYLRQHLRIHTGRFTCGHCLKIFCRKENLNFHNCSKKETLKRHQCTQCGKCFLLNKHLLRHIYRVHEKKFTCQKCSRALYGKKEQEEHNCSETNIEKMFPCTICGKNFVCEAYLHKHLIRHRKKNNILSSANLICEICGFHCKSKPNLYLHQKKHMGQSYVCSTCNKRFIRKDVFQEHILRHSDAKVICTECNKDCKNERTLIVHKHLHNGGNTYKCDKCPRTFSQIANLNTHIDKVHSKQCKLCNINFSSSQLLEIHNKMHTSKEFYVCPLCNHSVKLRSSLNRHIKKHHSDQNVKNIMTNIKPMIKNLVVTQPDKISIKKLNSESVAMEQLCGNVSTPELINSLTKNNSDNFENIVYNFENISCYNMNRDEDLLLNSNGIRNNNKIEKQFLDFTDLQMDLDANFDMQEDMGINNQEICLSMPDLTESDQEIMLGTNAYILDNGNIVERKDQGSVFVYVLDKSY